MKSSLNQIALAISGLAVFAISGVAADDCVPWTWTWDDERASSKSTMVTYPRTSPTPFPREPADTKPGELNCRSTGRTYDEVGYWSCAQIADAYSITIERFFELNPELAPDCDGIKPNTEYCVRGCKRASSAFHCPLTPFHPSSETNTDRLSVCQQSLSRFDPKMDSAGLTIRTRPVSGHPLASAAMLRRGSVGKLRRTALTVPAGKVSALATQFTPLTAIVVMSTTIRCVQANGETAAAS